MGGTDAKRSGAAIKYATGKKLQVDLDVEAVEQSGPVKTRQTGFSGRGTKRGGKGKRGKKGKKGKSNRAKRSKTEMKLASIVAMHDSAFSVTALKPKGEPGKHEGAVACACINPTGSSLITGGADHELKVKRVVFGLGRPWCVRLPTEVNRVSRTRFGTWGLAKRSLCCLAT